MTAAEMKIKSSNLMDKAVCLIVNTSCLGNQKKVHTSNIEIDADKDLIRVNKTLLDSKELKAIKSLDGEIRRWIYSRSSESPFTNGVYLLSNLLVSDVETKLAEFQAKRADLVTAFISVYPALVQDAKEKLQGVFNAHDYPKQAALSAYFSMDWNYWSFATPAALKEISAEFFEAEKAKAAEKWSQAAENVQYALRESFADLVTHMSERLSGLSDGTTKRFHSSTVSNIQEFLDLFKARNLTDDSQLESLVEKAKKLVAGVDPETLKENEGLRDSVIQGFSKIKTSLDTMLQDKPSRKIVLE